MTVLLHLSDPHFGTEQPAAVAAALRLARAQAPSLVLLSGDITQRARRKQFDAAQRFIEAIGAPLVLAVPGNHDIPLFHLAARLGWPYQSYRRAFGADLEPRHLGHDVAVASVNTTRWWRHKHGEISLEQVREIAQWLRATPAEALRIVMTHHPLVVTEASDLANRPQRAEHAARAWCEAGVDVVLSGHIHLPFFLPLAAAMPGLPRRCWAVQAGTVVSRRVRGGAPPSLNLLRRCPTGDWAIERWNFDAGPGEFGRVASQGIDRDRGPLP